MPEDSDVETAELHPIMPAKSGRGPFRPRTQVELGAFTHPGKVRPNNVGPLSGHAPRTHDATL